MGTEQFGTEVGACGDGGEPERRGHARPRRPLSTAVNENQTLTPQPKNELLFFSMIILARPGAL